MALIKDRAAPVFDSEQVHKGDLIRAKHKTWDEYRNGLVVGITSNELVVLYHTGIGNVSNHFVMLASEVAGREPGRRTCRPYRTLYPQQMKATA